MSGTGAEHPNGVGQIQDISLLLFQALRCLCALDDIHLSVLPKFGLAPTGMAVSSNPFPTSGPYPSFHWGKAVSFLLHCRDSRPTGVNRSATSTQTRREGGLSSAARKGYRRSPACSWPETGMFFALFSINPSNIAFQCRFFGAYSFKKLRTFSSKLYIQKMP